MTVLPKITFGMDVKVIALLQLFNKSKVRSGTKAFLKQHFFIKCKKLGFNECSLKLNFLLKKMI